MTARKAQQGKKRGSQRRARTKMRKRGYERVQTLLDAEKDRRAKKEQTDMTERYIDTAELAGMIPAGHPLERYKARILHAAEIGEDEAIRAIVDAAIEDVEAQELAERWNEEFGSGAIDTAEQPHQEDRGEAPQEVPDRSPGGFFGVDDLLKIAAQDDGPADPDQELHEALRENARLEREAPARGDELTDQEMWGEYARILGIEEEGR